MVLTRAQPAAQNAVVIDGVVDTDDGEIFAAGGDRDAELVF